MADSVKSMLHRYYLKFGLKEQKKREGKKVIPFKSPKAINIL